MEATATAEGPPAKRARLDALPSPALSRNSDPIDDGEDLYDPPEPMTTAGAQNERVTTNELKQISQPTDAGTIPGLRLVSPTQSTMKLPAQIERGERNENEGTDDGSDDFYGDSQRKQLDGVAADLSETSQVPQNEVEGFREKPSSAASSVTMGDFDETSTTALRSFHEENISTSDLGHESEKLLTERQTAEPVPQNGKLHDDEETQAEAGSVEQTNSATNPVSGSTITSELTISDVQTAESEEPNNADEVDEETKDAAVGSMEVFVELAQANHGDPDAEFEYDSTFEDRQKALANSSSDSDSSDEDSDSDEDGDGFKLLSLAEQARILMQEEHDGDDEGGGRAAKAQQLRTATEKVPEKIAKPDIQVTPDMVIVELGQVECFSKDELSHQVVILTNTSGEYRVLNVDSVLCLQDRTVVGAVDDLIGRVQQPRYSVRFTSVEEIAEYGITIGTKIFYVEAHSTLVFTDSLKGQKASDASNQFDEEPDENELEFSDDEAEAAHKRKLKEARQTNRTGNHAESRRPAAHKGGLRQNGAQNGNASSTASNYPDVQIKYDDDEPDELYRPLQRPPNLGSHPIPARPDFPRGGMERGRGSRGRGDRGQRGDRGGQRGDRGSQRGDHGGQRGRGGNQGPRENGRGHFQQNNRGHAQPGFESTRSSPLPIGYMPQSGFPGQSPPLPQMPVKVESQLQSPYPYPAYAQASPGQQSGYYPPYSQPVPQWNSTSPVNPQSANFQPNPPPYQWPPTAGNNLQPGAHVNPAFFRGQAPSYSPPVPALYQQQQQQQQQQYTAQPQYGAPYGYPGGHQNYYAMQQQVQPPTPGFNPPRPSQTYDPSRPWMG